MFLIPPKFGKGGSHAIRSDRIELVSPSIEITEFGVPEGADAIVLGSLNSLCWINELSSGNFIDGVEPPGESQSFVF